MKLRGSGKRLALFVVLVGILGLVLMREEVLRLTGSLLIVQDPLERADVIFVLGGEAPERGAHAASLFHKRLADRLVTTGGSKNEDMELYDMHQTEAEVTAQALRRGGVPEDAIVILNEAKSTMEEGFAALNYAAEHGCRSIIVVTSMYHTRRAAWVMRRLLETIGVKVMMSASGSDRYHPSEWWKYERDMTYVNSEYSKFLFYLLHYARGSKEDILARIRYLGD